MSEMYDGQLELEYTCVSCHRNTYPRRLASGYCSDCLIGGMTDEELEAERREHEAWQADYCARHIRDYARDVLSGKRTLKEAARACHADLSEMEDEVEDLRREDEDTERYWRDYAQDLAELRTIRNAAHIHRALRRGTAYAHARSLEIRGGEYVNPILRELDWLTR